MAIRPEVRHAPRGRDAVRSARWTAPIGALLVCLGLAIDASASQAGPGPLRRELRGRVLLPGGRPAAGALLHAEPGGRAVADDAGRFLLELPPQPSGRVLRVLAFASSAQGTTLSGALTVDPAAADAERTIRLEPGGCQPEWLETFGAAGQLNSHVHAFALHDDGSGPALYAGGQFWMAGTTIAVGIARFDGVRWSPVGGGMNNMVLALAVHDDGSGQKLYAGGIFTMAGGVSARYVAVWDGASWSGLASNGFPALGAHVAALAVFDGGSGPELHIGGRFTTIAGVTVNNIARWDGASWQPLGSGTSHWVTSFAVHDDGSGPALYVGGNFDSAGGLPAPSIARWDGSAWSTLGAGIDGNPGGQGRSVDALVGVQTAQGPRLYAGGHFTGSGAIALAHVAVWDGASWSPLGSGMDLRVRALAVEPVPGGHALYATGEFGSAGGVPAAHIARWDGVSWSAVGSGLDETGRALLRDSSGASPVLFIGGSFATAGGQAASFAASWNGTSYAPLSGGLGDGVEALAVFDDGSGPALYAGGRFASIGGQAFARIARWEGAGWSPLASGLAGGDVHALAVFDDGGGPALFAGGSFTSAGGAAALRIARWDGASWSMPGSGADGAVHALAVHDDGTGPALFAGGDFQSMDGVLVSHVARYDGSTWSGFGSGTSGTVRAIALYDDGLGEGLFVGGDFSHAGGVQVNGVARWYQSFWLPLNVGVAADSGAASVHALFVHDDGGGEALYVGGRFDRAGRIATRSIARWNGIAWSAVGEGLDWGAGGLAVLPLVAALTAFDDGTGGALHAGGRFTFGETPHSVARWDGSSWTPLGSGVDGGSQGIPVRALQDLGGSLFVGGDFVLAPDSGDGLLARWAGCANGGVGLPFCFGARSACPCANAGGAMEGCANSTGAGAVLAGEGSASVARDDLSMQAGGIPAGRPALLFAGTTAVNGGAGVPFGDGLRCAGGTVVRLGVRNADASGGASWGPGLASQAGFGAGETGYFQVWYRDPAGSPCGSTFNLSNGLQVDFN